MRKERCEFCFIAWHASQIYGMVLEGREAEAKRYRCLLHERQDEMWKRQMRRVRSHKLCKNGIEMLCRKAREWDLAQGVL